MIFTRILSIISLAFFVGCASHPKEATRTAELTPGDPSAPSQVTPGEALAIAHELATHDWRPFSKNIYNKNIEK